MPTPDTTSATNSVTLEEPAPLAGSFHVGNIFLTGEPATDALVFCDHHGEPISPNHLSIMWRRAIAPLPVPKVTLHALRHSHASALIAAGVDVVTVSRRLGHGSPNITLSVYAHLMPETDKAAAAAIERILR